MAASIGTGDKKSVNIELNIVPFIDLMSCLTAFLLVTAVWVNIAQINIQPKGKSRDQAQVQQDDEHVTLSVLVQSDRIWVGLSRVNEFQEIPKKADDQDWEKLETTLKEHKASAFFADRSDVEIAAESTTAAPVKYQDIIHAMDVAVMTILVCFLLMVFSASGQLLQAQKGLDLPIAQSRETLQQAPVIIVTKAEITYQGQLVATVDSVLRDDSPTFKIDALFERLDAAAKKIREDVAMGRQPKDLLKSCEDAKQSIRPAPGKICPDGLAILQADESTDARLINKIVNTAKAAGFDNLLFAVKNK